MGSEGYIHMCIHTCNHKCRHRYIPPTPSIICLHFLVNRFQKSILFIVQYKYSKSSEYQIFDDLILSAGFMTDPGWSIYFHSTKMVGRKWVLTVMYQLPKDISVGLALKYSHDSLGWVLRNSPPRRYPRDILYNTSCITRIADCGEYHIHM